MSWLVRQQLLVQQRALESAVGPQLGLFDEPARAAVTMPAGPAPYVAPAEQLPLWHEPASVHVTQSRSSRLPDGVVADNNNCGPASALMALRLVGLDAPGFAGERSQAAIDAVRLLATGTVDHQRVTNLTMLRPALASSGAQTRFATDVSDMLRSVRDGGVAIVNGNSNTLGWPGSITASPLRSRDTWNGHFVVASRYFPDRDAYAINDPGKPAPYYVMSEQLRRFATGGDGGGISAGGSLIVDGPSIHVRPTVVERGDSAHLSRFRDRLQTRFLDAVRREA